MSKYNLSELLTEVAGGRIGTLNISARDLVSKMEELEDKGVRVDRYDGLSADGKTYIEFHVHPIRKYDEDYSFSVYDFKFGFDPMSPEHADEEYSFSVGGRPSALDSAETTLRGGDMGYQINEDEFDEARQTAIESSQEAAGIKENMSKKDSLKKEMMIHVDQLIDGNIDMNDFMNVVEDIMAEANSMKEEVEIPGSVLNKIAASVSNPATAAKAMLGFYKQMQDKENIDLENNAKFKIAIDKLKDLADDKEVDEVMGIDRKGNKKPDTDGSDATKFKKAAMSEDKMKMMDAAAKMIKDRILKDVPMDIIMDFVKTHLQDIRKMSNSEIKDEFEEFRSVNYDYIDENLKAHFNRFK